MKRSVPRLSVASLLSLVSLATGCAGTASTGGVAKAPATAEANALPWAPLNAETFARARAEGRIVLVDGSAGWCHWCRVMDATTYRDPEVRKLLAERFLPVRVDVDARPDFEVRYHDWGWPATVLMTGDAEEIGKFRGYMTPEKLLGVLRTAASSPAGTPESSQAKATAMQRGPLSEDRF
jgi:thiol:disulfide interchange protein